jgi:hypothetical protein
MDTDQQIHEAPPSPSLDREAGILGRDTNICDAMIRRTSQEEGEGMRSEEPEPERDEITERVQRLEKRLSQFEQQLRSFPEPPATAQDTDAATASPAPGTDTAQEQEGQRCP